MLGPLIFHPADTRGEGLLVIKRTNVIKINPRLINDVGKREANGRQKGAREGGRGVEMKFSYGKHRFSIRFSRFQCYFSQISFKKISPIRGRLLGRWLGDYDILNQLSQRKNQKWL